MANLPVNWLRTDHPHGTCYRVRRAALPYQVAAEEPVTTMPATGPHATAPLTSLPTPCLIVDEDRMATNLDRAQGYANAQGVALRPHTKTHKSPVLAREQLGRGASGVCVAKLGEAEIMADAGIGDLFLANTVLGPENAARAVRLAGRLRFAVGVDHLVQIDALASAAREADVTLAVRVEVDTGAGRGGIDPADLSAFLAHLQRHARIRAEGIYTYEGYTYDAADAGALRVRHQAAQRTMVGLASRLRDAFDRPPVVSMGSTPSQTAEVPLLEGITEIRPGTSIFLDAAQAALAGGLDRCAAHVLATVVSRVGDRAILDAGSKSLTSDARGAGVCATRGHGRIVGTELVLARLSEEHGVVEGPGTRALSVGDRVRIVPNHICPVVNLFDRMVMVRGDAVTRVVEVAARGRVA